ncbi:MAG: hypothetical protein K2J99_08830 [Lachnospiraceae bacterium]|nr:hypothetical protein [Lachnospiraceae bacterium]
MHKKITYEWLMDKCICILLVLSMLSVVKIEIVGFPIYSLLLLVMASVCLICKIIDAGKKGISFLSVKYLTDTAAMAAITYAVLSAVIKLFASSEEGAIDFSWNAEVIALAIICLLISSETAFKLLYFDLLLYSGLLTAGLYIIINFTDGWENSRLAAAFADSGQLASYFLLVSMVAVYGYCTCRSRMRSIFYIMMSGISFFALFVNQNMVSLWLMGLFFLAVPVLLRPTAMLVKRAMQLFFMYLFMLSNMGLFTEYTQILQTEISYSLEHSVYLDLLVAAGGVVFFHYWDRIPEGTDLERLVLRKMQKGYRFIIKVISLMFISIIFIGNGWAVLPDNMACNMVKSFTLPLAEAAGRNESGILYCFRTMGVVPGIFLLISIVLFFDRMYKNYAPDKPITDILILISVFFAVQLLFWNPGIHNIVCNFYLLAVASFYKEEREQVESVGVKASDLELKIQEIQI